MTGVSTLDEAALSATRRFRPSLNANIVGMAGEAEESFVSRVALLKKE